MGNKIIVISKLVKKENDVITYGEKSPFNFAVQKSSEVKKE